MQMYFSCFCFLTLLSRLSSLLPSPLPPLSSSISPAMSCPLPSPLLPLLFTNPLSRLPSPVFSHLFISYTLICCPLLSYVLPAPLSKPLLSPLLSVLPSLPCPHPVCSLVWVEGKQCTFIRAPVRPWLAACERG